MLSTVLAAWADLQVELEVLDVGEADLLQLAGAAAAVLEVHLLEPFGGDLPQLLRGGALLLGLEEAGRLLRGNATVGCRMRSWSVDRSARYSRVGRGRR